MEEQIISFETAKLAKEKGFGGKGLTTANGYFRGETLCIIPCNNKSDFCAQNEYSAPTQSLLQKWLREVHKLIVIVAYQYEHDSTPYSYWIYKENNSLPLNPWINDLNIYEEALELGLQEALKLIE